MITRLGSSAARLEGSVSATRLAPTARRPEQRLWGAPPRRTARMFVVPTMLLGADVAAFAGAVALTAAISLKTAGLLVLIVVLYQTAGLYRRRLSFSILDDAPAIVGRALAGGAGAMVAAGLNDGRAGITRLVTAALFGVLALGTRSLAYSGIRTLRRRHRLRRRT